MELRLQVIAGAQQVKDKLVWYIAALLKMLSEISQQACTSVKCAWSKPSQGEKASLVANLDFSEGYTAYNSPV